MPMQAVNFADLRQVLIVANATGYRAARCFFVGMHGHRQDMQGHRRRARCDMLTVCLQGRQFCELSRRGRRAEVPRSNAAGQRDRHTKQLQVSLQVTRNARVA